MLAGTVVTPARSSTPRSIRKHLKRNLMARPMSVVRCCSSEVSAPSGLTSSRTSRLKMIAPTLARSVRSSKLTRLCVTFHYDFLPCRASATMCRPQFGFLELLGLGR